LVDVLSLDLFFFFSFSLLDIYYAMPY